MQRLPLALLARCGACLPIIVLISSDSVGCGQGASPQNRSTAMPLTLSELMLKNAIVVARSQVFISFIPTIPLPQIYLQNHWVPVQSPIDQGPMAGQFHSCLLSFTRAVAHYIGTPPSLFVFVVIDRVRPPMAHMCFLLFQCSS